MHVPIYGHPQMIPHLWYRLTHARVLKLVKLVSMRCANGNDSS